MKFIFWMFFIFSNLTFASSPSSFIGEIIKIRGDVTQLPPATLSARGVSLGEKLIEDTSIVTGPKSFVRIKFIDNSELNIGPESKIVISEMKKNTPGIISLLKGRVRAIIEKTPESIDSKESLNKFFIKTRTAAMGVRGTDFQTIYNPENKVTSLLTFKGQVAMAKVNESTYQKLEELEEKGEQSQRQTILRDDISKTPQIVKIKDIKSDQNKEVSALNKILTKKDVVLVASGENSFSSDGLSKASPASVISPVQLEVLSKNVDLEEKAIEKLKGIKNPNKGRPPVDNYIDLASGLTVSASGEGHIDADTGQFITPPGLIIDPKKGFILDESFDNNAASKKELVNLKNNLNNKIPKGLITIDLETKENIPLKEEISPPVIFKITEKFSKDRLSFSLMTFKETLKLNKQFELKSELSKGFSLDWQMGNVGRFTPKVGLKYTLVKFDPQTTAPTVAGISDRLMSLSYGAIFAFSKEVNFYSQLGLHQAHFLDQTAVSAYSLQRVVIGRLSFGSTLNLFSSGEWTYETDFSGFITFKKSINNLVINQGTGYSLEFSPKYKWKENNCLLFGLKLENESQKIESAAGINSASRNTLGFRLSSIIDF